MVEEVEQEEEEVLVAFFFCDPCLSFTAFFRQWHIFFITIFIFFTNFA